MAKEQRAEKIGGKIDPEMTSLAERFHADYAKLLRSKVTSLGPQLKVFQTLEDSCSQCITNCRVCVTSCNGDCIVSSAL